MSQNLVSVLYKFLSSIIKKALCPPGSIRRIWIGKCRGMKFKSAYGMSLGYSLSRKCYNMGFLASKISPGMCVYDIGANRGQLSLLFSKLVKSDGLVVAFEPVRVIYDNLCDNLRLNNINNVLSYCIALSFENSKSIMNFDENLPTMGKLEGCEPTYDLELRGGDSLTVDVKRLDDVSASIRLPDIIKIDVEGALMLVLEGSKELIKNTKPSFFIEIHGPEEGQAIHDYLSKEGYVIEDMEGNLCDPRETYTPFWCYVPKNQNAKIMKKKITCKVCDDGSLELKKKYRFSKPVAIIGNLLLIPSVSTIVLTGGFLVLMWFVGILSPTPGEDGKSIIIALIASSTVGILIIVSAFISGLLGWILVMKIKLLRCSNCNATVEAC